MCALNIEQKFECKDLRNIILLCKAHNYEYRGSFIQKDVYFGAKGGRLKIREINRRSKELIYYKRIDSIKARESKYYRVPLDCNLAVASKLFTKSNGLLGIVKKTRKVFYNKNIRINIDKVEGLGTFVEFEAEIGGRYPYKMQAKNTLERTKKALRISEDLSVSCSYIDLIRGK